MSNALVSEPSSALLHSHVFDDGNPLAERNTRWAVLITAAMMVAEIAGGWIYQSMALLADGWHMSSHTLALGLALGAYVAARRLAGDGRFAFGTWKIGVLAGFASALLLLGVAALMLIQSLQRLWAPVSIAYDQAIALGLLGLAVNLVCAWLLREHHGHAHGHQGHHEHGHSHDHHGHAHGGGDLNQRAAFLHVLADAATSALAIAALLAGKWWGADWLDPVMGLVGAVLVAVWALGLLRDSSRVLLDAEMDAPVVAEIREAIASSPVPATITDLHVWRVATQQYACLLSLSTAQPQAPEVFKQLLQVHEELVHITVEVNPRAGA